VKKIFLFW